MRGRERRQIKEQFVVRPCSSSKRIREMLKEEKMMQKDKLSEMKKKQVDGN